MTIYRVTISYFDNCRPLIFTRHIPVFAAGVNGVSSARGTALRAYCDTIRLPLSKITSVEIAEDPFTCLADCENC